MVELVAQLFQQMKGICSAVQALIEKTNSPTHGMTSHPKTESTISPVSKPEPTSSYAKAAAVDPPRAPPENYRKMVREELRELEEQRKRRSSLVVRGLGSSTPGEAVSSFEAVSEYLIGKKVSLTDVVRIPGEADLYRGKVTDDDARKMILDKAKHLKGSNMFGSVFIRRDLTYNQRALLKAKRAAAGLSQGRIFTPSNQQSEWGSAHGQETLPIPHPAPSTSGNAHSQAPTPATDPSPPSEETIPKVVDVASN